MYVELCINDETL